MWRLIGNVDIDPGTRDEPQPDDGGAEDQWLETDGSEDMPPEPAAAMSDAKRWLSITIAAFWIAFIALTLAKYVFEPAIVVGVPALVVTLVSGGLWWRAMNTVERTVEKSLIDEGVPRRVFDDADRYAKQRNRRGILVGLVVLVPLMGLIALIAFWISPHH